MCPRASRLKLIQYSKKKIIFVTASNLPTDSLSVSEIIWNEISLIVAVLTDKAIFLQSRTTNGPMFSMQFYLVAVWVYKNSNKYTSYQR